MGGKTAREEEWQKEREKGEGKERQARVMTRSFLSLSLSSLQAATRRHSLRRSGPGDGGCGEHSKHCKAQGDGFCHCCELNCHSLSHW